MADLSLDDLSEVDQRMLCYVRDNLDRATGKLPTYRKIADHLGWKGASLVSVYLQRLESSGHLLKLKRGRWALREDSPAVKLLPKHLQSLLPVIKTRSRQEVKATHSPAEAWTLGYCAAIRELEWAGISIPPKLVTERFRATEEDRAWKEVEDQIRAMTPEGQEVLLRAAQILAEKSQ